MFLFDWLFPIKCYGCNQNGQYLCSDCQVKIKRFRLQAELTRRCQPNSFLKKIISLYPYKPPLIQMLKDYKYHQVRGVKKDLVKLLETGLKETQLINFWKKNNFVFIPVPLHPFKKMQRGFNQSEELLIDVCRKLDLAYDTDLVKRVRWTKTQTKLSLTAREKNMHQAFVVNKKKIFPNSNLIIFDDVLTTGATLLSCARAFKNTSVNSMWGATLFCRL